MDLSDVWDYIEEVAAARLKNNKSWRHYSGFGPRIETLGAAGELVARRFLSQEETLHTHFDGGVDIYFGGQTIDVKAMRWEPGFWQRLFLQWPYWKPVKSQIVLVTAVSLDRKAGIVVGYALPHEITRTAINLRRAIWCHEVPVKELHPAGELLHLATRLPQAVAY